MIDNMQIGMDIATNQPTNQPTKIFDVVSLKGDEYYTLEKDAETIAQHIIRPMTVWLPFNDRGKAPEKKKLYSGCTNLA